MDPTAFLALAERCAPPITEPRPLAALVRRASEDEPLAIRFDDGPGGPMKLLGSSKAEAIQLASELVIAGHRVRVGLAGIDTRDLDKLGVSLADAFEPCSHLRAAARLMSENPAKMASPRRSARAEARASPEAPVRPEADPAPASPQRLPARAWDVYGQGRLSSALVYGARD